MLKKFLNLLLIIILLFFLYEIGEKYYNDYINKRTYEVMQQNKELKKYDYDWITIPGTYINYPIAWGKGNDYYLTHDINGVENKGGAIFYEEQEEPFVGTNTIIYGHSMNNGSMFNNLHLFRENQIKFINSKVIIERKNGETKVYKPLGVYITNKDFFYYTLDNMDIDDAVELIQSKSIYDINVEYTDKSDIITLMTCSYENKGGRLLVFYISE